MPDSKISVRGCGASYSIDYTPEKETFSTLIMNAIEIMLGKAEFPCKLE